LKKNSTKETVNVVSFACGSLFQDLVIYAKAIQSQGVKNINIHLVDTQFEKYIKAFKTFNQGPINTAARFDAQCQEYSLAVEQDAENQEQCQKYLRIQTELFREFVSFLKVLSEDKIKVYVHGNAESYREYCMQNPEMQADMISAIDFDQESYESTLYDYYYLIYTTLKKDGIAILADNFLQENGLELLDDLSPEKPRGKKPNKKTVNKQRKDMFMSIHTKKKECSKELFEQLHAPLMSPARGFSLFEPLEVSKGYTACLSNTQYVTCMNEGYSLQEALPYYNAVKEAFGA
jgi:hypothetical protein